MFLQFVVHAHARQPANRRLPSQPNPSARPSAAARSEVRRAAANANPTADSLKSSRSLMSQLNTSTFVATKFLEIPSLVSSLLPEKLLRNCTVNLWQQTPDTVGLYCPRVTALSITLLVKSKLLAQRVMPAGPRFPRQFRLRADLRTSQTRRREHCSILMAALKSSIGLRASKAPLPIYLCFRATR
jgi:hypothetical protein